MYIRGLIPRNFVELAEAVPIVITLGVNHAYTRYFYSKRLLLRLKNHIHCVYFTSKENFYFKIPEFNSYVSTRATTNLFPIHLRVGTFERHFKKLSPLRLCNST